MQEVYIGELGEDGKAAKEVRKIRFENGAEFSAEIIPTVFKGEEFANSPIVWLETGVNVQTEMLQSGKHVEAPVRAPILLGCTAPGSYVVDTLMKAFSYCGGSVFSVQSGKRYLIHMYVVKDEDAEDSETPDKPAEENCAPHFAVYRNKTEFKSMEPGEIDSLFSGTCDLQILSPSISGQGPAPLGDI